MPLHGRIFTKGKKSVPMNLIAEKVGENMIACVDD